MSGTMVMLKRVGLTALLVLSCPAMCHVLRAAPVDASAAYTSHCDSSSPKPSKLSLPEVRGLTARGKLWALLFYQPPAKTGTVEKIVLRMTGSGPIHVVAIGPSNERIAPSWGPERHGGSNWSRPGGEWGTGWQFPTAGCWHLHARRTHASGNIWLDVQTAGGTMT